MPSTSHGFGPSPRSWVHFIEAFIHGLVFRYSEFFTDGQIDLIWGFLDDLGMGANTYEDNMKQLFLCLMAGKFLGLTFNPDKIDLPATKQVLLGLVLDCENKTVGVYHEKV